MIEITEKRKISKWNIWVMTIHTKVLNISKKTHMKVKIKIFTFICSDLFQKNASNLDLITLSEQGYFALSSYCSTGCHVT